MTESRKQFEKWCESIGLNKIAWHPYSDDIGETAWQAWQASRAAAVVKLPLVNKTDWESKLDLLEEFKDRLNDAGIRYE